MLRSISNLFNWFPLYIEWLVSVWNVTHGWNELICLIVACWKQLSATHNYFGKKSSKTIILGCLCVQKSWEIGNKIRKDEFFNWHHRLEIGILINCNLPCTLFWLFSQTFWTRVSEYASEQILLCLYENQTKTYLARVNLAKLAGSIFTEVR